MEENKEKEIINEKPLNDSDKNEDLINPLNKDLNNQNEIKETLEEEKKENISPHKMLIDLENETIKEEKEINENSKEDKKNLSQDIPIETKFENLNIINESLKNENKKEKEDQLKLENKNKEETENNPKTEEKESLPKEEENKLEKKEDNPLPLINPQIEGEMHHIKLCSANLFECLTYDTLLNECLNFLTGDYAGYFMYYGKTIEDRMHITLEINDSLVKIFGTGSNSLGEFNLVGYMNIFRTKQSLMENNKVEDNFIRLAEFKMTKIYSLFNGNENDRVIKSYNHRRKKVEDYDDYDEEY
ncbi:MAG: hypothetical protein MJ252_11215 [archaeon]|nr:hypothetical protein [archaeon]